MYTFAFQLHPDKVSKLRLAHARSFFTGLAGNKQIIHFRYDKHPKWTNIIFTTKKVSFGRSVLQDALERVMIGNGLIVLYMKGTSEWNNCKVLHSPYETNGKN